MSIETMTKIATVTVGSGGSASIEFTNIPQTYTDLVVVVSIRDSGASSSPGQGAIRFNGDTASNYARRFLRGNGTTADSGTSTGTAIVTRVMQPNGATANTFGSMSIYIPNYTNSNYKSVSIDNITENNGTEAHQEFNAGIWNSTSAISAMSIFSASGNTILQYSTATLYGVRNARRAAGNSVKAIGGNVSFDGTYVVHTFNSSGTFTPTSPIRTDILVLAGGAGGGGGFNVSGAMGGAGGGAGGLQVFTNQYLSPNVSYSCTVGAGGSAGGYANQGGAIPGSAGGAGSNSQFSSLTASVGGGGGGNRFYGPGSGGSGGGTASDEGSAVGTGTAGQGNNGGAAYGSGTSRAAGGGGGAGAVGGRPSGQTGGSGGAGGTSEFISSLGRTLGIGELSNGNYYLAGGGGGGGGTSSGGSGTGGIGGGGAGGAFSATGTNGQVNRGGGGGGGAATDSASGTIGNGGSGGSGVVIIRYKA